MKQSNKLSKNVIAVIIIGIIRFAADIICPWLNSIIISTAIDLLYTAVVCFAAAVILSEGGCVFSQRKNGERLLSRNSIIRMIIAFIISAVLSSSVVVRIITVSFNDIASMSVACGILAALSWIAVYTVMTVKNNNSPRIGGLLIVYVSALVFSVLSQYITGMIMYASLQNANGTLLGYLSAASSVDIVSLIIVNAADIIIMCTMASAAHFFRKKN